MLDHPHKFNPARATTARLWTEVKRAFLGTDEATVLVRGTGAVKVLVAALKTAHGTRPRQTAHGTLHTEGSEALAIKVAA